MAGYDGYSMSNNARYAYENGEKPLSKWAKKDIIEVVGQDVINRNPQLKALKLKELRALFLTQTAWHHTSKFYNETNFYACRTIQEVAEDPDGCALDTIKWPYFPEGDNLTQESPEAIAYNKKKEETITETWKIMDLADAIARGDIK